MRSTLRSSLLGQPVQAKLLVGKALVASFQFQKALKLLEDITPLAMPAGSARPMLEMLQVGPNVPVVTRDQVEHAKPDPDLFLAAAERLGVDAATAVVVGDSVWDLLAARRARALGVGLLSGGYGQDELERAGAYRVYQDPKDLLYHLDEIGVRAVTAKGTA